MTTANVELPRPVEQQHVSPLPTQITTTESPQTIPYYAAPSSTGVIATANDSNLIDLGDGYSAPIPDPNITARQIPIQNGPSYSTAYHPVKIQQYSSPEPQSTQTPDLLSQPLQSLHLRDGAVLHDETPNSLVRTDTQSGSSEEFVDAQEG